MTVFSSISFQELKHENIVALLDFQVCNTTLSQGVKIMSGSGRAKASVYIHDSHTSYWPSFLISPRWQTGADGLLSVPHDPLLSNAAWTVLFSVLVKWGFATSVCSKNCFVSLCSGTSSSASSRTANPGEVSVNAPAFVFPLSLHRCVASAGAADQAWLSLLTFWLTADGLQVVEIIHH